MKTFTPPQTTLDASNVILGLMRISELDDQEIRALVGVARDAGINYFDHADGYGGDHGCETRFGDAVTFTPAERESVIIQSKVGIRDGFWDFSQEHILEFGRSDLGRAAHRPPRRPVVAPSRHSRRAG